MCVEVVPCDLGSFGLRSVGSENGNLGEGHGSGIHVLALVVVPDDCLSRHRRGLDAYFIQTFSRRGPVEVHLGGVPRPEERQNLLIRQSPVDVQVHLYIALVKPSYVGHPRTDVLRFKGDEIRYAQLGDGDVVAQELSVNGKVIYHPADEEVVQGVHGVEPELELHLQSGVLREIQCELLPLIIREPFARDQRPSTSIVKVYLSQVDAVVQLPGQKMVYGH